MDLYELLNTEQGMQAELRFEVLFSDENMQKLNDKSNKDLFVLHVKGESMINVGIYDGDLIIVSRQPDAKNGDTVVALIEDEATVKTFYREKDYIRLQPENDTMAPILVKEVAILGKVVGLFRNMM